MEIELTTSRRERRTSVVPPCMLLVPATMELLGDANWWLPKWLDKLLPNVHIEGEKDLDHEIEELLGSEQPPVVVEEGAPR